MARPKKRYEYAVYKGDSLICIGDLDLITTKLNIKPSTVKYLCSKTAWDRYNQDKSTVAIRIDMDELDKEMEEEEEICKSKRLWMQSSQAYLKSL